MDRYDIVRCIRCGHLIYYKDAELSKPGSTNFGIKAEYMCEKCYLESGYRADGVAMLGMKRRSKQQRKLK